MNVKKYLAALLGIFCLGTAMPAGAVEFVNIATGPTGGTYYPVGSAMAKIWSDNIAGVKASAQSTGGTMNNIQLLADGEAEAAFADGLYYDAYNGLKNYENTPQKFLRVALPLYPEAIHMLVAKNSGIRTLADLKGKRVCVGAVGGSTMLTAYQLFKAAGLDPEHDIIPENLGHADTVAAFADKRIDASVTIGAIGIASALETTTLGTAHLITIPGEIISRMCRETPYFSPLTIPAGTYRGQTEDIHTFSSPNVIAVHEKLDDDLVYEMTRTLFADKADLVAVSARMSAMNPGAIKTTGIPIHPGALRYYRELGILK